MKRQALLILLVLFASVAISAQTDAAVARIRRVLAETDKQADLALKNEEHGQTGPLVINDLTINLRDHHWRAVGTFRQEFRFFYRGGNSEEHLYPDELVLVRAVRKVSNRSYAESYLFDEGGSLIFYFQRIQNPDLTHAETHLYFAAGKAIRITEGGRTRDRLSKSDLAVAKDILDKSSEIKVCFQRSIEL